MKKILLVDDHPIVRKGIRQILEDTGEMQVTAEARTSAEAFHILLHQEFDALIIDISLPGRSGLDLLHSIRKTNAQIPILVLSMYPEEQYALRCIRGGANGYLTKDSAPENLIIALRKILEEKVYLSDQMTVLMSKMISGRETQKGYKDLSDREYYVLCKLGEGYSLTRIAEELSLSPKTISTYKTRLFRKLGFSSLADLSLFVHQHKLRS